MAKIISSVFFIFAFIQTIICNVDIQYCGNTPADVVFMLDSSNSIWGPDFQEQLDFVTNIVSMFQIGETATRVGVATFNDDVQLQFNLNEYYDKEGLMQAVGRVRQSLGSSTSTDLAMKYLRREMFNTRHGGREDVPHIAIVVTDGRSKNMLRTLIEASRAKRKNIHIFTIGVGSAVNDLELNRMASWPPKEYAFLVSGFPFLFSIQNKLAVKTCQVTKPPTTTTRTTSAITTPRRTTTTTPTTTTTRPTTTTTTTTTTTAPTTTTPTIPTTTTTSGPTTTTWIDVVRQECRHKAVDIVFAMDSSDMISASDFWYQIRFVRDFTLGLDIGENKTRIGVVLYSDQVVHGFDVNDHANLLNAINSLYRIQRTYGGTRLDEVIRYVRTRSFRRTVSRRNAAQVAVFITGSSTKKLHRVKKEAIKARTTGVNIIAIGVGKHVNPEELKIIASANDRSPNEYMDIFAPVEPEAIKRRHIYQVDDFASLLDVVMDASMETCTAPPSAIPVSDQACGTRQEADMMFVMDSASAGRKNTKKTLDFVKKVAGTVEVDKKSVQIGMIQPDECIPPTRSFRLNDHKDKSHLVQDLTAESPDEFIRLLKKLRKSAFKKRKGGRSEAKKIAIILVDGDLEDPLRALAESQKAKISGIEVYVIVVGNSAPQREITEMCNYPPRDHLFTIPNYEKLKDLEDSLIELLCDEL